MKVGLDLTKPKIKKFKDFVIQESSSSSFDLERAKEASKNIGLDLTKEKQSDKIDLTKYGEDIE
ncbi:MAG: hypothetical protein K9J13_11270 [Saprospiraceae bacterium]|nr:hypothetical protein [Saprospiraceae bacterium]